MDKRQFADNVKRLREKSGLTQEQLAENSGLSLRTVQRMEGAEVTPRSDTIIMLANALNVSPAQLADWSLKENRKYLAAVNLSALTFMVFPLLGIIFPVMMWLSSKDHITHLEKTTRKIVNFQITWGIIFICVIIPVIIRSLTFSRDPFIMLGPDSMIAYTFIFKSGIFLLLLLLLYNIIITIVNCFRALHGKEESYFPSIRFLKY